MRLFAQRYTVLARDALIRGDSEIVIAAARSAKSLPISLPRRLILILLEMSSLATIILAG